MIPRDTSPWYLDQNNSGWEAAITVHRQRQHWIAATAGSGGSSGTPLPLQAVAASSSIVGGTTVTVLLQGAGALAVPGEMKAKVHDAESPLSVGVTPWMEFIACLVFSPDEHDEILGDFSERFHALWEPRFGAKRARVVYLWHVALAFLRLAAESFRSWLRC